MNDPITIERAEAIDMLRQLEAASASLRRRLAVTSFRFYIGNDFSVLGGDGCYTAAGLVKQLESQFPPPEEAIQHLDSLKGWLKRAQPGDTWSLDTAQDTDAAIIVAVPDIPELG